ncbi:MAG: sulfite exporter TauE/SafE family protein [Naasia sp.]
MTAATSRRRFLILALVGIIGGVLSGAFGVGGGIVMVPLLVWLAGMDQKIASATSLAAIVPATIVGSVAYILHNQVDLTAALALAVGAVPGALIGTWLLRRINIDILRWLFIVLMLAVAVRMVFLEVERGAEIDQNVATIAILVGVGLLTGIASGLFGVGGGVIMVPVLVVGFGMGDLIAKGTSLVAMIASSTVGTASNIRAKKVDWKAGLIVGVAATLFSYAGVALALIMSPRVSSVLFAALLFLAAGQLIVRTLRQRRTVKVVEDPAPAATENATAPESDTTR